MANVAAPNEALQTLLAVRVVRKVEAYILLDSTLRKASGVPPTGGWDRVGVQRRAGSSSDKATITREK